jgi:hypothetical protein
MLKMAKRSRNKNANRNAMANVVQKKDQARAEKKAAISK